MAIRRYIGAMMVALTIGTFGAHPGRAESHEQLSEAQIVLFRTPHLDNVTQTSTLTYDYSRQAVSDDSFSDTVTMTITEILPSGAKNVDFDYLTGERHRPFGSVSEFRGNPLIMVFLEDDVDRMSEALGGGNTYMRNRIRHAFFDSAETMPISLDLNGRRISGTRISIAPFVGDRHRDRIGEFEHKTYEFVVSPEVPGSIYRIRSTVPSVSRAGKPKVQETLTFSGLEAK